MLTYRFNFNQNDIPSLTNSLLEYIEVSYGHKPKQIAEKINSSLSYFYKLRKANSDASPESRRSFFVRLLKEYELSMLKDEDGNTYIVEQTKVGYYIENCYLYIYENETKRLISLKGKIDLLEMNYVLKDFENDLIYAGNYRNGFKITEWNLSSKSYIGLYGWREYFEELGIEESDFGDDQDLTYNLYNISFVDSVSDTYDRPYFGFFTRVLGYGKTFSGRAYLSSEPLTDENSEVAVYLTDQKFHEFFDHNVIVSSVTELTEFVNKYSQKIKYIQLDIPEELVSAYHQFLSFFSNYVAVTKGKLIKFDVLKNNDGLTIDLELKDENINMEEIKSYINEYIKFSEKSLDDLRVNVERVISDKEFDIFLLELKQQINNLNQQLSIAAVKNSYLEKDNTYLRGLVSNFSQKESITYVQQINDGNQQFAKRIKNVS